MHRNKTVDNRGFTLAETLLVVAIVVILMGVVFISLAHHQRTTKLLEMDGIAKEIYIAAQNHLSLADSQGLISQRSNAGTQEGSSDVYYFIVSPSYEPVTKSDSVLNLMLPLAAVDETVRLGGSYIVRYQKSSATVLDVFYSNREGVRFGHNFTGTELSNTLLADTPNYRESGKDNRRNYGGAVIGWYGGAAASELASTTLLAPDFEIINGDTLSVEINNPNSGNSNARLTLIVRSTVSRNSSDEPNEKTFDLGNPATFSKTLDDVTVPANHFNTLFSDAGFIPGEDIEISLMVSPDGALGQPIIVGPKTTNSLFGDGTANGTAEISSFRHLENLDSSISGVNPTGKTQMINAAEQTNDMNWSGFWSDKQVYTHDDIGETHGTKVGCYYPVTTGYRIAYDGTGHSITGVKVEDFRYDNVGLFGTLNSIGGSSVSNLQLLDFQINGTNAGALAGAASGSTVENVIARNQDGTGIITGTDNAGGLVGTASSTVFDRSAAVIPVVSTEGNAGGLVGKASSGLITRCYSGGQTDNGEYYDHDSAGKRTDAIYNVQGATNAGGLVGDAGTTTIQNSYSTCSASGATDGGLAGKAGGAINNCYATGLVNNTTTVSGAFVGSYTGTADGEGKLPITNCKYYRIINENKGTDENGNVIFSYTPPLGQQASAGSHGVVELDADASAYNSFVGAPSAWKTAEPDDEILNTYYTGKYPLPTIERLVSLPGASPDTSGFKTTDFVAVHYGDWPAPELRVVNVK